MTRMRRALHPRRILKRHGVPHARQVASHYGLFIGLRHAISSRQRSFTDAGAEAPDWDRGLR